VVGLAALMGAVSALLLAPSRRGRLACGLLLILVAPLALFPQLLPDMRLDETKGITQMIRKFGGHQVQSRWDPLARIDVVEKEGSNPTIFIDAAAATAVAAPVSPEQALGDLSTLPFQLVRNPSVAIIGPGGGTDVQNALALGAREITAVEINPVIIDLVTDTYADHVGHVFEDPRVHLVRDEGRSFIGRSQRSFGVIEITLIDTWAASVAGAYSLSENYLYTTEGLVSYLVHLDRDGCLAITRWYYEAPRLVAMARAALTSIGIGDPSSHVAVVEQGVRTIVLVKREPFSEAEAVLLRTAAQSRGRVQHDPLTPSGRTIYDALLMLPDPTTLFGRSDVALSPVTDESPFFFQMTRWRSLWPASLHEVRDPENLGPLAIPVAQIALVTALVLGVALSVVLLAVPIARGAVPREERWRWLAYFLALGIAYIIVEVVLMQRLALFLGHPTYSVTAVLFAILLFSGLGSAWSGRRHGTPAVVGRVLIWGIPLAIALVAFAVPPIVRALIGLPLPARMAIATAFIAPLAFLMGMPFPIGIRVLGARGGRFIPWAWAANGCGSVLGSVWAVLGAMLWSFSSMLIVAGLIYACALLGMARVRDRLA
jgi:hypothetical protein